MWFGKETQFLRLSQFRQEAHRLCRSGPAEVSITADSFLHDLGRFVFQSAWHEDQSLAMLMARHFEMPCFGQAIELLYLVLGGELCELRGAVDDRMLEFFDRVYVQPAIRQLLKRLPVLEGRHLNELPRKAGSLYRRLTRKFTHLLGEEAEWGEQRVPVPLHKVIFANLGDLEAVAEALRKQDGVIESASALNASAEQVVAQLLDTHQQPTDVERERAVAAGDVEPTDAGSETRRRPSLYSDPQN
jgi:hypothetical protein